MASREEIREGVAQDIRLGICAYQHLGFDNPELYYKIADEVLKMQDRRGVVLKVERKVRGKLVNALWDAMSQITDTDECHAEVQKIFDEAGYETTESLIEEE